MSSSIMTGPDRQLGLYIMYGTSITMYIKTAFQSTIMILINLRRLIIVSVSVDDKNEYVSTIRHMQTLNDKRSYYARRADVKTKILHIYDMRADR